MKSETIVFEETSAESVDELVENEGVETSLVLRNAVKP